MTAHLDPAPIRPLRQHPSRNGHGAVPHSPSGLATWSAPLPRRASDALDQLLAGNHRHAARTAERASTSVNYTGENKVLATVLTCCDLSPSPEQIFDTAPGELVVTATAAHLVDTAALVGVEYGAGILQTPLVVVLAHEPCPIMDRICSDIQRGDFPSNHCRAVAEQLTLHTFAANSHIGDIARRHLRTCVTRLQEASATLFGELTTQRTALVGLFYSASDRLVHVVEPHSAFDISPEAAMAAVPRKGY